jgi:hypothetical protein
MPGNHLPGKEPAFKKTIIKYASWREIPLARAYEAIYSRGIKKPHSIKNTPSVVNARTGSLRIVKSGRNTFSDGGEGSFGGKFARTSKHPGTNSTSVINAIILVDHAKPTLGAKFSSTRGYITPPILPPDKANPVAAPRLRQKKCPILATGTMKINDVPVPPNIPTTSKKCQYCVQKPINTIVNTISVEPVHIRKRGPFASKMGPIWMPQKKTRKL